jgi:hypothetical protein
MGEGKEAYLALEHRGRTTSLLMIPCSFTPAMLNQTDFPSSYSIIKREYREGSGAGGLPDSGTSGMNHVNEKMTLSLSNKR